VYYYTGIIIHARYLDSPDLDIARMRIISEKSIVPRRRIFVCAFKCYVKLPTDDRSKQWSINCLDLNLKKFLFPFFGDLFLLRSLRSHSEFGEFRGDLRGWIAFVEQHLITRNYFVDVCTYVHISRPETGFVKGLAFVYADLGGNKLGITMCIETQEHPKRRAQGGHIIIFKYIEFRSFWGTTLGTFHLLKRLFGDIKFPASAPRLFATGKHRNT